MINVDIATHIFTDIAGCIQAMNAENSSHEERNQGKSFPTGKMETKKR